MDRFLTHCSEFKVQLGVQLVESVRSGPTEHWVCWSRLLRSDWAFGWSEAFTEVQLSLWLVGAVCRWCSAWFVWCEASVLWDPPTFKVDDLYKKQSCLWTHTPVSIFRNPSFTWMFVTCDTQKFKGTSDVISTIWFWFFTENLERVLNSAWVRVSVLKTLFTVLRTTRVDDHHRGFVVLSCNSYWTSDCLSNCMFAELLIWLILQDSVVYRC